MKTAMQELIEFIESAPFMSKTGISYAAIKAKQLLEKEKQQIIGARDDGFYSGTAGTNTDCDKTSLQYYNETFKP